MWRRPSHLRDALPHSAAVCVFGSGRRPPCHHALAALEAAGRPMGSLIASLRRLIQGGRLQAVKQNTPGPWPPGGRTGGVWFIRQLARLQIEVGRRLAAGGDVERYLALPIVPRRDRRPRYPAAAVGVAVVGVADGD